MEGVAAAPAGEADLALMRALLRVAHPTLADLPLRPLGPGWDSLAAAVGDTWALKVPRDAGAEAGMRREVALLRLLRGSSALPVPAPRLFEAPRPHTLHPLIPGRQIEREEYEALSVAARDRMAEDLAGALHALHRLPEAAARAAGMAPMPDVDGSAAIPMLPPGLRGAARRALAEAAALGPDPWGEAPAHLDAHGWNLAWDATSARLRGLLDFGDAGIAGLHREMVQPSLTSYDLAARLAEALARLKGRPADHRRWRLYAARSRLAELAAEAEPTAFARAMAEEGVREAERGGAPLP